MNGYDDNQLQITADRSAGRVLADGCWPSFPGGLALTASLLAMQIGPGVLVIGHNKTATAGQQFVINAGGTLADGNTIKATAVAYWNQVAQAAEIMIVEGAEAVTADAVPATIEEIQAALPAFASDRDLWLVLAVATFSRSGSDVAAELDASARVYGVSTVGKSVSWTYPPATDLGAALGTVIEVGAISLDSGDLANGDLGSVVSPVAGKYLGVRLTLESSLGGGTAGTLGAKVGGSAVAGVAQDVTGSASIGEVTGSEPTDATWIAAGEELEYTLAGVTAGSGRVRIAHLVQPYLTP